MRSFRTLAASLLLACFAGSAARADALASAFRYMLIEADTNEELGSAAGALSFSPSARDRGNCDLIAESLWRIKTQRLGWHRAGIQIIRVLPYCPDAARYSALVERAWQGVKGTEARAHYLKFRDVVRSRSAVQYEPGSIDIDALRAAQRLATFSEPTLERARAFAAMPANLTPDELVTRLGTPTHVVAYGIRTDEVYAIDRRELWFLYRGIGRVTFTNLRDVGWRWTNTDLEPVAFEAYMPYRARSEELGLPDDATLAMIQLLQATPLSITESAKRMYQSPPVPAEYLDTAAELLLQRYGQVKDPVESEAYSWICNVLTDRGGLRYAKVLRTVADDAPDRKLRRFGSQHIEVVSASQKVYVPGSIDLEAQRRKYSTLYPALSISP